MARRLRQMAGARRERLQALSPWLALGAVLLLLWSAVLIISALQRQRLLDDTVRDLGITSRATVEQTQGVFRDAETGLRIVDLWLVDGRARSPADLRLGALADTLRSTSRGVALVMLATPSGVLYRPTASGATPSASLGAQPALAELMRPDGPTVVVGNPVKLSPIGARMLPLIMRLRTPVGEIALAVALIDMERLGRVHATLARSPGGSIGLLRSDGTVLSRVPEVTGLVGRSVFETAPERRTQLAGDSGWFLSVSSLTDGVERLVVYRRLEGLPIYATVSQSVDGALVSYEQRRVWVLAISALISAAAIACAALFARMQRRARWRETEFAATLAASPLPLFRTDARGETTDANDGYLRLYGLSGALGPWGRPPLLTDADLTAMASGQALDELRRCALPDGRAAMLALRTAPLRVGSRIVGHVGTVQDLTDALAHDQAQRRLTALFDATPDCIVQMDIDGQFTAMNREARRRLGLSPMGSLDGLRTEHIHPPEVVQLLRTQALPQALATGQWSGRVLARDASGREMAFDEILLAHRGHDGRIDGLSAILREASAEIEAEHQRERSEAVIAALARGQASMITVLDRALCVRYMNRDGERGFGVQRDQWLGRPVRELLGETDFHTLQPLMEAALRGEPASLHLRHAGRLERRVFNVQYLPLRAPVPPGGDPAEGAIDGVIGIADDITDARQEERRLRDPAHTDEPTQLLNQRGFERRVEAHLARARQDDGLVALLRLTLAPIAPAAGTPTHLAGEPLLRATVGRLRHALRPQDIAARLGSDQFAVLLPGLRHDADAAAVAERVIDAMAAPFSIEQHRLAIRAHGGLVVAQGGEALFEPLMAGAQHRLLEAERSGHAQLSSGGLPT